MRRRWLCAALVGLAPFLAARGADAPPRIAVCDMERIMKSFAEFKSAEDLLQKQLDDFRLEQDELQGEGDKLRQEFEAARSESENKALSESARDKQLEAAKEKLSALREHEMKTRKVVATRERELSERGMRMRKRIVTKLRGVVKEYADKQGIVIVLDSSALGVNGVESLVYGRSELDITDEIVKIVSAMTPEAAPTDDQKEPDARPAKKGAADEGKNGKQPRP